MRGAVFLGAMMAAFAGAAHAQRLEVGTYLCAVEQRATISSTHLEGAAPPRARGGAERYRFRIVVTADGGAGGLRIVEAPYDGPDRSLSQWEDDYSTLHTAYVGDGRDFSAVGAPGFMNFVRDRRWGEDLQFYHAGYQYAGGEDEHLSVRWGRCTRE